MRKFRDHYSNGAKALARLPKEWLEYPTSFESNIRNRAAQYASKIEDSGYTWEFPEDPRHEFFAGLEDACLNLHRSVVSTKRYAVFEYRSDNKYERPISPTFESMSVARNWLSTSLTEEQHYHGGAEQRGYCVRTCYPVSTNTAVQMAISTLPPAIKMPEPDSSSAGNCGTLPTSASNLSEES